MEAGDLSAYNQGLEMCLPWSGLSGVVKEISLLCLAVILCCN